MSVEDGDVSGKDADGEANEEEEGDDVVGGDDLLAVPEYVVLNDAVCEVLNDVD